ncbi:hypothetical protein SDC9_178344 [bioreactor metagenome]|uniref:Uncharacterized protein n=1 Tax=bioreactor metagenome TaxID=1076179 RepID=A0A645H4U8_9ZZZZ
MEEDEVLYPFVPGDKKFDAGALRNTAKALQQPGLRRASELREEGCRAKPFR